MIISDEELVRHYLENRDDKALETLVKRYLKGVYNLVYRYTGNVSESEDITQDIFIRLWKKLKLFDHTKCFRSWFFTLAKNYCHDWGKKQKREIPFSAFEDENQENMFIEHFADTQASPYEDYKQGEIKNTVRSMLNSIPRKYRQVMELYYLNEYSLSDIAKKLGKPLNTVKSWHRRALLLLKGNTEDKRRKLS